MTTISAPAKINLALVVGPRMASGKHELATVYERITLADTLSIAPASELEVEGFPADTLVALALRSLAAAVGVQPAWRVTIEKRIPVGAGLGGGSSDAAAALELANESLPAPLGSPELHELAATLGADVPLFLARGPQLGEGDGTRLTSLPLTREYCVLVLLPHGEAKPSTKAVYDAFDDRGGDAGFDERRRQLLDRLREVATVRDLALLPRNDLVSSPYAAELEGLGAARADVSGAGPAVYALFEEETDAHRAAAAFRDRGRVWVAFPAWYG